jgi:ATP-binding cassette, subfamily B, bacterial HlyB/CyaB
MNEQSTISHSDIQTFLQTIEPFDRLSVDDWQSYLGKIKPLRYRMGQKILINTQLPSHVSIVFTGKVRLIGIEPSTSKPVSLQVLETGELLGWIGLIRDFPCETALASEETICFALPAADFNNLLQQHPTIATAFDLPHRAEVFDLITRYFQHQNLVLPRGNALSQLVNRVWQDAIISRELPDPLTTERIWFDSQAEESQLGISIEHPFRRGHRLIGLSANPMTSNDVDDSWAETSAKSAILVEYAPDLDFQVTNSEFATPSSQLAVEYSDGKFPSVKGEGVRDGVLACFQMISLYLGIKYRRETVQRIVDMQLERNNKATLQLCAAIAEVLGLMGRLMDIPANQICRIQNPAIIAWEDSFAVIYQLRSIDLSLSLAMLKHRFRYYFYLKLRMSSVRNSIWLGLFLISNLNLKSLSKS